MEKPLKIRLHVLSPIHIGCDDVYEPTSFVIDAEKKKLIEFDPMDFVKALNDKQRIEFSKVCSQENLVSIYKFINSNKTLVKGIRETSVSEDLINHYNDALRQNRMNQFILNKTAFNPYDNTPYIPGSSLKGSLRTAHLNTLAIKRKNPIVEFWKSSQKLTANDLANPSFTYKQIGKQRLANLLEKGLLGIINSKEPFSDDPFRLVKISDLLPVNINTKIVYAVDKSKTNPDRQTRASKGDLYQMLEIIQPDSIFEGVINSNINNLLPNAHEIFRKNRENDIHHATWLKSLKVGIDIDRQYLVRIGRHSGAEAVTIEGNRYIKIMQKKGEQDKYLDHATTLWLASDNPRPQNNNDLQPFGWAVLEIVPFDVKAGIYTERKDNVKSKADTNPDSVLNPAGMTVSGVTPVVMPPKAMPEKDNSLAARTKLIKNLQTFTDFIKGIKDNETEELSAISFKGMESVINIGLLGALESAEVSAEIKKIIAQKMLEVCKEPDKKYVDKLEKYRKLQAIAGLNNG